MRHHRQFGTNWKGGLRVFHRIGSDIMSFPFPHFIRSGMTNFS